MISKEEIENASNNLLRGNDIDSAIIILEEKILNQNCGETTILKIATRQAVEFMKECKDKHYLDIVKEKVQANERCKQLENKRQEVIDYLEKEIEENRKCMNKTNIKLDKLHYMKRIEYAKEILEIMRGEE